MAAALILALPATALPATALPATALPTTASVATPLIASASARAMIHRAYSGVQRNLL